MVNSGVAAGMGDGLFRGEMSVLPLSGYGGGVGRGVRERVVARGDLRGKVTGKYVRGWDSLGWKLILSKKTCFSIKNSFAFGPF